MSLKGAKNVYLTVGTTRFDKLINRVLQNDIIKILKKKGFEKLILQIGKSEYTKAPNVDDFEIEMYRYKDSIADDIASASLIICHAGAGSILESLSANKPVISVINDDLMNNHQTELANQLSDDGHLFATTCRNLAEVLEYFRVSSLVEFEPGNSDKLWDSIDELFEIT